MGTDMKGGGVPDCTSHWIWLAKGVKPTFFFFVHCHEWLLNIYMRSAYAKLNA